MILIDIYLDHCYPTSMTDTAKTILHSATRFFSGTMLSRVTGMLRDMSMAYAFGTQSTVAALLVAFRFAHLLRRVLGEGAMQTALIPHLEHLRKDSSQRAGRFYCDLSLSLTALLSTIIIVTMLILGGLLSIDFFSTGNAEIAWFTLLMMPSLLFICLFGINASLLQCEKSYFIPSAAPIAFNVIWIVGVICTRNLSSFNAMSGLSLFIILACFAQWALTLPKTYKILIDYGVTHFFKGIKLFSTDVYRLAAPLALGIIGVAAAQINNALDAVFARWADDQGPALLWYAIRLQQLPLALFGVALSGALLPPLARAIKGEQFDQFSKFLDYAVSRTLILMIPITVALFIMGDACIALIYGHGDFSNLSVIGTTECLWGYTAGLIPMALILVLAPAFYAKGNYRTPSMASAASMALNIGLNTILVAGFDMGAASIAFATSISAWFNCFWLWRVLSKDLSGHNTSNLGEWKQIAGVVAVVSCLSAIVVIITDQLLWGSFTPYGILIGEYVNYLQPLSSQIIRLSLSGLIFIVPLALAYLKTNKKGNSSQRR